MSDLATSVLEYCEARYTEWWAVEETIAQVTQTDPLYRCDDLLHAQLIAEISPRLPEDFLDLLTSVGGRVAGSIFPWLVHQSSLTTRRWNYGDLDIFVPIEYVRQVAPILFGRNWEKCKVEVVYFVERSGKDHTEEWYRHAYGDLVVDLIGLGSGPYFATKCAAGSGWRRQHTPYDASSILRTRKRKSSDRSDPPPMVCNVSEWIEQNFDLPFVQCSANGKFISIRDREALATFRCKPPSISSSTFLHSPTRRQLMEHARMLKYLHRGATYIDFTLPTKIEIGVSEPLRFKNIAAPTKVQVLHGVTLHPSSLLVPEESHRPVELLWEDGENVFPWIELCNLHGISITFYAGNAIRAEIRANRNAPPLLIRLT